MFAHQVIESVKKWNESGMITKEFKDSVATLIQKAQKVHVGDVDDIEPLFARDIGTPVFMDTTILRLPYKAMWFDFTFKNAKYSELPEGSLSDIKITNSKEAALVYEVKETMWGAMFFSYIDEYGGWIVMPAVFLIFVGGTDAGVNLHLYEGLKHVLRLKDAPVGLIGKFKAEAVNLRGGNMLPMFFLSLTPEQQRGLILEWGLNCKMLQCAIKLINCKNITLEKIPAPARLNKKRRENGRQELFDYHVLNVVVPSKQREYRESQEPLSHNRVHLCRGHFKVYTAEHPLFGSLIGQYWWQPHARGQNKNGIVVKDYQVITKGEQYGQALHG